MGKLTIRVHKCQLLRPAGPGTVNPRLTIVVDNTYHFQTHTKRNTHNPEYNETFVVGNTHHLAIIELSVYDMGESSGLLQNFGHIMNADSSPTSNSNNESSVLLGRCYISIRRLVQGRSKTRTYYLGTPLPKESDDTQLTAPRGVAGMVSLTLESDSLGEPPSVLCLDNALEQRYVNRLKRLLLRYDKPKIQVLDLILSNVRDPTERLDRGTDSSSARTISPTPEAPEASAAPSVVSIGGDGDSLSKLSFNAPTMHESFDQLMTRLCRQYGGPESSSFRVSVRVDGCTNLNKKELDNGIIGTNSVYVVLRTESEDFVTRSESLKNTVVWSEANETVLDVVNPSSFVVQVIVMGKSMSTHYEIGRSSLSVAPLALDHLSSRHMFLCSFDNVITPTITGMAHLSLKPLNFGLIPMELIDHVDDFYNRLGKFFCRYDPVRIPHVDMLIHSRLGELEDLMQDLVVEHGREPGTVRLHITIDEITALRADVETELNEREVCVNISMGRAVVKTKPRLVRSFASTKFDESYAFDVVRETDLLRIEVVKASDETVVYGRVDFTCLNTQRSVQNKRKLYLVGNAGTQSAFLSGLIRISLYSDEVGHAYEVDTSLENMFAGRLRRYASRRIPESLHRVNLAVATVFDMETFMAKLATEYGPEDPTCAVYFTVIGCRQLLSRFGGISPYVVVRLGIDSYQTKFVKDTTEPDYFEFCEFYYDVGDDRAITLVVMDHSEIGDDQEIGHAVIPLDDIEIGQQYHDFLPLQSPSRKLQGKDIGCVGFKFVVNDLNLVDRTRTKLTTHMMPTADSGAGAMMQGQDRPEDDPGAGGHTSLSAKWSVFKRRMIMHSSSAIMGMGAGHGGSVSHSRTSSAGGKSDDPSFHSAVPAKRPTFNLMDEGVMSIESFCAPITLSANTSTANNSDAEWSDDESGGRLMAVPPPQLPLLEQDDTPSLDSHLMVSLPKPVAPSPPAPGGPVIKQLRVRLLYAKDVQCPSRKLPNPYFLLSTIAETHRSQLAFSTTSPQYNEEFVFRVFEPHRDCLFVTVLTDTPFGAKKLGHCVFSLKNVQRGVARTRWASLVVHSHHYNAFEQGSVCLSIAGEGFGLDYMPSVDAENRLRERVREFLVDRCREQLHALEWYVGEYCHKDNNVVGRMFGKYYSSTSSKKRKDSKESADVRVTVHRVFNLHDKGLPIDGNAVVKIKVGGKTKFKTHPALGLNGTFTFNDTGSITVTNPGTATLRLCVAVSGHAMIGECYLSLADLHKGAEKQRQHILVTSGSDSEPCGYVLVSMVSGNFGSTAAPPTDAEEARYGRLRRYLYYYLRSELPMADVRYATTLNAEAYLQRLVEKYGPEPADFHVRLTLKRCTNVHIAKTTEMNLFCIVRSGLEEFRTSIVQGKSEFVFFETFDLPVGLPEREKIDVMLMNFFPVQSVEVGRTQIPLDTLRKAQNNALRLPLIRDAGTKYAETNGTLELDMFTEDFGLVPRPSGMQRSQSSWLGTADSAFLSRMGTELNLNATLMGGNQSFVLDNTMAGTRCFLNPRQVLSDYGVTPQLLAAAVSGDDAAIAAAAAAAAPSTAVEDTTVDPSQRVVRVTLLGFAGVQLAEREVYIRVTDPSGLTLLRTKPLPTEKLVSVGESFEWKDVSAINDFIFTLKIGKNGIFGSDAICYADFCLTRCPPNRRTEKALRLYDLNNQFIGLARLRIEIPQLSFAVSEWKPLPPSIAEPVMDDLSSLVRKYSPKDLRRLDPMLYRSADIRRLHRSLRLQLAPTVVATAYVAVHHVDVKGTIHNECTVSATVGAYSAEVARRHQGTTAVLECGMSKDGVNSLSFPIIRVDISLTGSDAVMTLRVNDRMSKERSREIGRATVSLRALLTVKLYDMGEEVTVPLVSVRQGANRVHASLVGTITFALLPPAYESYPSSVRFPSSVVDTFSKAYFRYYGHRIWNLLRHYDANSLVNIHAMLYETYAANKTWENGLPKYLSDLVMRWGREIDPVDPVPPLDKLNSSSSVSNSLRAGSRVGERPELAPMVVSKRRSDLQTREMTEGELN